MFLMWKEMEVKYSIMAHTEGSVQPDIPSSATANSTYLQEEDENSLTNLSPQQ